MLTLDDTTPGNPLALHFEPIYIDGKICGNTTSANYSFNYNKNLLFGYINLDRLKKDLYQNSFSVLVEKKEYEAILLDKPLHDPNNYNLTR